MRHDISASFQVTSQLATAQQLQALIELPEAEVHGKGDPISGRSDTHYYQQSIIRISSALGGDLSVDAHINHLLDRLEPQFEKLTNLPDHCSAELWVKVSFETSQFGFEMHPSTISRLARHRVELLVSVYTS